jgi:hypothetical protein
MNSSEASQQPDDELIHLLAIGASLAEQKKFSEAAMALRQASNLILAQRLLGTSWEQTYSR